MVTTFIYGLYSSDDNEIRYVGKANDPKDRLRKHLYECRKNNNENKTHKCCWIRNVLNKGEKINYVVLDECEIDKWEGLECKYMGLYDNLTNTSKGGIGGSPRSFNLSYNELVEWKNTNLPENCNTHKKWKDFINSGKYEQIPVNPNKVYSNRGWTSWGNFLNTGNKSPNYYIENNVSFEKFKEWVNDNQIKTSKEFFNRVKMGEVPENIPKKPHMFYKNKGWTMWCDIVSGGLYRKGFYWSYYKCKEYLRENYGVMTAQKFRQLCKEKKLPLEIPKKPERVFENFNYCDFLNDGINNGGEDFYYTIEKSKLIVIEEKINSVSEWRNFIRNKNKDIRVPGSPDWTYRKIWKGWDDFLNKKVRD
jgi:hypothetical protein